MVAEELGYQRNALAKGLVQQSSSLIGFITDDVATTPFAGQIIQGAQNEALKQGKTLLIINTNDNEVLEHDAFKLMLEYQVQGIIYSTWYHHEVKVPRLMADIPLVLVNCFEKPIGHISVVPNEESGGEVATDALINNGHKKIAFINTTSVSPAKEGRLRGYMKVLDEAGIQFDSKLVINAEPNQEGGYQAAKGILNMGVTAVFCHNDRVAMGLYDGLKELNAKIPEDISIVGFDDQEIISNYLHPKLSTVALPHYDLGILGTRKLLESVNNKRSIDGKLYKIECPIILRDSIRNIKK